MRNQQSFAFILFLHWFGGAKSFAIISSSESRGRTGCRGTGPRPAVVHLHDLTRTAKSQRLARPVTATKLQSTSSKTGQGGISSKKPRQRPVFLTHERDFFRQEARLNSMDSYVLVSTLTASMSFGCLIGFSPHLDSTTGTAAAVAAAARHIPWITSGCTASARFVYQTLCLAIQVVSGLSALCGLYATIIFSLTILYGKSALGAERDREYDRFLRRTVRARVHGTRCFSGSLALFAVEALLVNGENASTLPLESSHFLCTKFSLFTSFPHLPGAGGAHVPACLLLAGGRYRPVSTV